MDRQQQWVESISHTQEELALLLTSNSQMGFRAALVEKCCENHGDEVEAFDAVVGRGGLLPPVHTGAYEVDDYMLDCLKNRPQRITLLTWEHRLLTQWLQKAGVKAYIYDAVAVDEMEPLYRTQD